MFIEECLKKEKKLSFILIHLFIFYQNKKVLIGTKQQPKF